MNPETGNLESKPDLSKNVDNLRREAGNVAQGIKEQATAKFQDVRDQAASKVQDVRQQASTQIDHAMVTAKDLGESVQKFATEHPLATFSLGILFGLFLSRKKD